MKNIESNNIYSGIAILILIIISYFLGMGDGREKVCSTIRSALLDNSRVPLVISSEFSQEYLKNIEKVCNW